MTVLRAYVYIALILYIRLMLNLSVQSPDLTSALCVSNDGWIEYAILTEAWASGAYKTWPRQRAELPRHDNHRPTYTSSGANPSPWRQTGCC